MKRSAPNQVLPRTRHRLSVLMHVAGLILVWLGLSVPIPAQEASPRFVQELPDAGRGEFVKCDLQHRFSDAELTVTQFVARAMDGGCRVIIVAPPRPTDS